MVAPEWVVQHPHSARERGATNRAHGIFKGRHFEASLILQAVSWYLRYPLSYRDIEELFLERGLEVDHATLNRWVLAYALLIERGSGKNLGHYAASWVACWPRPKRPSSTVALTWSTRWAPRGDQRICPRLFMRALTRLLTVLSARDVEIGLPAR